MIRNFEAESKLIINNLLPEKSCEVYQNVYKTFMQWHQQHKASSFSENILIVYFNELSKKYKPTTLWAKWSMLRAILNLRNAVDINKYINLKTFFKNYAKGYKPKKANPFTLNQIKSFLEKADDHIYLVMKVFIHILSTLNNNYLLYIYHPYIYCRSLLYLVFVVHSDVMNSLASIQLILNTPIHSA